MTAFTIPDGYVLLPQAVYDSLVKSSEVTPADVKKPVHLLVRRAVSLGDIRTQLNPDERIEWIPKVSVTIRGKVHTTLGSFLTIWNKQDPNVKAYDPDSAPFFEVLNPEVLDSYYKMQELTSRPARPVNGNTAEVNRIRREEERGTVKSAPVPEDLPPRGSPERKAMILERAMDSQHGGKKTEVTPRFENAGNNGAELKVNEFPVHKARQNGTVSQGMEVPIPGLTAEMMADPNASAAVQRTRRPVRRV
jgi:hypothetical protein